MKVLNKILIKDNEKCDVCHKERKAYDIVTEQPINEKSSIILYRISVCEKCKETYITHFRVKQNEKI